ncbi:hypothetical protein BDV93DRAFT_561885 [Ceratobasidium sp. AG-I]|nr:hypothetical protein BDV93DRAFT_561885 [Ceratobasidium sp. AG-I]
MYTLLTDNLEAQDIVRQLHSYLSGLPSHESEASRAEPATGLTERGLTWVSDQEEIRLLFLNALGDLYGRCAHFTHDCSDHERVVHFYGQVNPLTSNEDDAKPVRLNSLASAYLLRFEHLKNLTDLTRTIDCYAQANNLVPDE